MVSSLEEEEEVVLAHTAVQRRDQRLKHSHGGAPYLGITGHRQAAVRIWPQTSLTWPSVVF